MRVPLTATHVEASHTHSSLESCVCMCVCVCVRVCQEGTSLKQAALSLGLLTEQQFDEWVKPELMLGPSAPPQPK